MSKTAAEHEPIARVLPMLSVPHLDREFDYLVAAEQSDDAQPGVRVRVRFHGRLVDAFILERRSETDHVGKLGWLDRVVSAERVLTPEVRRLADAVAARYAGTRADVLRLAIPPRHANVEKEAPAEPGLVTVAPVDTAGWAEYGRGEQFFTALHDGRAARAVWQALPGERWADRLAEAAAATVEAGRGVLAIVPDQRDVDALRDASVRLVDEAPGGGAFGGTRPRAALPPLAVGAAGFSQAGDRNAKRGVRSGRRSRAGAGVGRRRRHAGRAPRAVSARPRGGNAACTPIALCRNDRRLLAYRRGASVGAQPVGARSGCRPTRGAVPGAAGDRAGRQRVRAGARPGRPQCAAAVDGAAGHPNRAGRRPPGPGPGAAQGLCARTGLRPLPHHRPLQTLHRPALAARSGRFGCGVSVVWPEEPALRCARCGSEAVRAVVVGARRTAEELGRAFPGTTVVTSGGDTVVSAVPGEPALVVATPGAEPAAAGGYGAALLLDAWALLGRQDLRAGEDTLRRWMAATTLVRSRGDGGVVVVVAESTVPTVQALIRWDPVGHAEAELDARAEVGLPPAVHMAAIDGAPDAVAALLETAELPDSADIFGPVELPSGARRPPGTPAASRGQPDAGAGAPRRGAGAGRGVAAGHRGAQRPARSAAGSGANRPVAHRVVLESDFRAEQEVACGGSSGGRFRWRSS